METATQQTKQLSPAPEQKLVPLLKPDTQLQKQIAEIAKEANGKVGVYATLIETGENVSLSADEHFALQSVVKVPIAMAVLQLVNEGKLGLDQMVAISNDDLVPWNQRSPIRDANPKIEELSVRELIRFAISDSDGTASDVLQRLAGGAKGVQVYVDSIGVGGMHITRTHKEFGLYWKKQFDNWSTASATAQMLKNLFLLKGISEENRDLLLRNMTESNNPQNRLKKLLPENTIVAHKTGTGGNHDGASTGTHDVGIITLPNGDHMVIAVLIGDSRADVATRRMVIAKIARAAFEKWSGSFPTEPVKTANFTERHTLN